MVIYIRTTNHGANHVGVDCCVYPKQDTREHLLKALPLPSFCDEDAVPLEAILVTLVSNEGQFNALTKAAHVGLVAVCVPNRTLDG